MKLLMCVEYMIDIDFIIYLIEYFEKYSAVILTFGLGPIEDFLVSDVESFGRFRDHRLNVLRAPEFVYTGFRDQNTFFRWDTTEK